MRLLLKQSLAAALCVAGLLPGVASQAGETDLADKPLANATTATILPNIMLDLDNSGSMSWSYMPDYVRMRSDNTFEGWCRDVEGGFRAVCQQGDPLYNASAFNRVYYNPAVRYQWPVNADGTRRADLNGRTSYADSNAWRAVPSDGYNVLSVDIEVNEHAEVLQDDVVEPCLSAVSRHPKKTNCLRTAPGTLIDLTTRYPERKWCTDGRRPECRSAVVGGEYLYPNGTYRNLQVAYGAPYYYKVKVEWCNRRNKCIARRTSEYRNLVHSGWQRVDIRDGATYPKAPARTDCRGTSCTYAEEMSNFATWYAWYRTRSQTAKSAIGHAFVDVRGLPKTGAALLADPLDPSYFHARIGLTTINKTTINLPISEFEGTQKDNFFRRLYEAVPAEGTPLRDSLNEVGKMYAGTSTVYANPIQYSCQRNFAILATDGYWNGAESGLDDLDSGRGVSRPSYMPSKDENAKKTLADVAYYYYHTDLRTDPDSELSPNNVPSAGRDPNTDDVATHQHMTTFTLGLGVDGTLAYTPDYKTAKEGDYRDIVQGVKDWPSPRANEQTTIDDLWHAAVSGRGTYFSAQDPVALEEGMRKALGSIESADGSGAAAATSNLQPTPGDNFIYIANYRTQFWDGELSAHVIDLGSGEVSAATRWQASTELAAQVKADGTDTRRIWTSDANHRLVPFKVLGDGSGLSSAQQAYFNSSRLSQYAGWTPAQRSAANAAAMVDYLRGHDPKVKVGESMARLFRERIKILGDFVHSQPVYVRGAPHSFSDEGYAAYKAGSEGRDGTVYAAANDGMLHAFDAATGAERWAYIPPLLLPRLWQLADDNYGANHQYFLDGPLAVSDANIDGWKTVLIGAMGKGGRGYYALDISDPAQPRVLWTFTAADNPNVGFSYGTPFIVKRGGRWVAMLTSGYNNVPGQGGFDVGDGRGYIFTVDLASGREITEARITTGVGSTDDPSGLARINVVSDDFNTDATAVGAYGGDLKGNLWRFNLANGSASKLLELGSNMPITTAPEIASFDRKRSVFVATGRFLGNADLTSQPSRQAIIGVRDNGSGTVSFPGTLIRQSLDSGEKARRNTSKEDVDWAKDGGWYVEMPDRGERAAIDPQLYFGTLLVSSVVPTASPCQPGGYSWMYQLDYRTGGFVNKDVPVATWQSSPIVGMTVSKLPNGTPVIHGVTADGKRPKVNKLELAPQGGSGDTKRLLWRELGL